MKPSRIGLLGLFGMALTAWAVWGTPRPAAPVVNVQSQRGADRVIVYPEPGDTIAKVQAAGVTAVENRGAYWLIVATPAQVTALRQVLQGRVEVVNHFNEVEVGEVVLDVTKAAPLVPAQWRERHAEGRRLRIVQFTGPVVPAGLKQLQTIPGVRLINYVPNNAYLISVSTDAEPKLHSLISSNGLAQWIGVYQPFYKVPSSLRAASGVTAISITVLDDETTASTLTTLQRYALGSLKRQKMAASQWLVTGSVNGDDLPAIAQMPAVLAVQPVFSTQSRDEVQGLVLAGYTNNAGGPAAGDSYVNYLSVVLGFPTDPSQYPTLDICDTGVDATITPDQGGCIVSPYDRWSPVFYSLPNTPIVVSELCCAIPTASRMIYNLAGSDTDGHGTRVASVAVGYDNRPNEQLWCITDHTEFPLPVCSPPCVTNCIIDTNSLALTPAQFYLSRRDNRGGATFQLGLGISPFGTFGASPMPDVTTVYSTAWNAYQRLARISNNSWTEALIVGGNDGFYDNWCVAYDTATRDVLGTGTTNTTGHLPMNQEMLFVFAAGNDNGVASVGGYGDVLITPPATAKNVLTVGASVLGHNMTQYAGAVTNIASQSSFGPTRDGRIKPDVVAPGEGVAAAISQASYSHRNCGGCDPNFPDPAPCANGAHALAVITNPVPTMTELFNYEESLNDYWTSFPHAADTTPRAVTSYAAAAVSGGAQLLWWWIQNKPLDNGHPLLAPSPAMLKGYIMNSARYLPIVNQFTGTADKLPSIAQGMGLLDLPRMFDLVPRVLRDETTPRAIEETMYYNGINYSNVVAQQTFFSQSGQSFELTGVVAVATAPFRVTLAWTDAAGSTTARKALVNDLDLSVTINGVTYAGNDFGTEFSAVDPNPQYDHLNNVESVFLPASSIAVGMPWKILVRATNLAGPGVPNINTPVSQDFALVIYNADSTKTSDLPPATPTATNNTCQGSVSITNFPFTFTNQLTSATYANVQPSPAAGRGGIDEFFKIAHPSPGTTFSVNTFGSGFDTVLSVWHGSCGALVEDVSNNDSSNTFQSAVSFIADGLSDYYIVAEPHNNGPGGTLVLNVQASGSLVVLEPSSLIFPDTISGTTSTPQTVTIHNGLTVSLEVLSANLLGSNATEFVILSENCSGAQLSTNGTCAIQIAFAPTSTVAVARNAQLTVVDNATGSPRVVPLAGNVLPPAPVVCLAPPSRLVFTNQPLLTASSQDVVVQNCGTADLIISNAWIRLDNTDFVLTGATCGAFPMTNAPGASCSLHIQFMPHVAGLTNAVLSITNNDGVAELFLLGTGCGAISITPTNLPLPTAGVAYSQSLTASNGSAPYTFAVTAGALPSGLTLSSSGTISGTVTNLASYTFQVTATDAYGCRSTPQQYAGTISCPTLILQPTALPDGLQAVSYTNTISVIGGIAPFTFTMSSGVFPGVTLNSTNGVLAGTPSVVGPANFTVAVTDANGCTSSGLYTVNIAPTAPIISFDPVLLPTFGDVVLGTTSRVQSVTIANSGTAPLIISGAILTNGDTGEFILLPSSCGTVPVGGTCTVSVRFAPTSSGNKGASVMVFDNASGSPQAFTVKGRGIAPVIGAVPGSVDFGTNNVVGQWSAPQWVQVYNTGDGVLTITNVSLISTNAPDFTNLVDNCAQILPGDSCSLGIAFRALSTGLVETATLVIDSTATNGEQRLPLRGSAQAVAPALGVSPVSLLFSNTTVGQTSVGQAITVRNAGTAALVITNLSFSGGGTDQFVVVSTTCVGASILPNGSCTILVAHTPAVTGVTNSNLRILSNAGNGTNLVPVLGFGVAPAIAPAPTSVGFGSQAVGIPSAAQLVLLSNTGDAPFTLSSLSIGGTNGGDFAAVPAGCTAVPPGGDCLVSVTFTPGSLGVRTGTLLLNGNATNTPVQVPLSGTGTTNATSLSLAPQNLAFGNVAIGTTSVVQSVTVANNGNAALIITNIDLSVSGEFVLGSVGCLNTPLAPGATCTVNLKFIPSHSGATNALIRIWNNSGVNPASVPVSGVGATPLISPHPAAVAFGNQPLSITSTAQIIQVQNTGLAPLTLSSVIVSGTTDFVASPIGCTAVAPGGSCNVSVVYTPSTLGATNATLWLTGNADNSPVSVPLTGAGVPSAPVLLFNPTLLPTFGNVSIGLTSVVQSVTVSNGGTAALVISNVTLAGNNPGDFILDPPNTCVGISVLPGGTCTISVKFTPTTSGNRGADVVVTNNAGIPQSFPVKGAGIAPSILVTPTVLDFGTQTVAVATAPQWVVAKNTGDGPMTITSITFISTNAPDFSLVENNCLGSPIQPGDSCLLGISFTPGAALPRTGTLVIESTATNGEQRVHLSGVGTAVTNGPAIDWAPLNLAFGNVAVGATSVVQSVTVTNHNTAPLVITNIDLSVTGEFIVSSSVKCLNTPLVSGQICTLSVTFVPTNSGAQTSFVRIWNNTAGNPAQIPLSGVGVAPVISPQPTVLAFGNQPVGVTSASQTIQVQNTGAAPLTLSSVTVVGPGSNNFVATPAGCTAVPVGGSCSVSVVFTPSALGLTNATVVLSGNADNSPVTVPVSGTGVAAAPSIGFRPGLLPTFGDVVVGTTSVVQSVTVTNSGNAALVISSVVLAGNNPGDFLLDPATTCVGGAILPGSACTISVRFTPTVSGNRGADVVVTDNAGGSPHSFPVKGAGIGPVILALPSSIDFGTQTVSVAGAPQWVQIYNTGNGPLTITGLTLISTNAPDFSILANPCLGSPIAPGGSCSLGLMFTAGAALPRTATLVIDNDGTNGQQRIHLTGVGTNTAPGIEWSPLSLTFGDTPLGTTSLVQTVTVNNNGTAPLLISSASLTGGNSNEFIVVTNNCLGAGIVPGGTCTFRIGFAPTGTATRVANLQLVSNVGNGTNLVPLLGTGTAPAISVNPTSLTFGNQPVSTTSAAQLVYVHNSGSSPLLVTSVTPVGTNAADFAVTVDSCLSIPILPGGDCQFSVTFTPGSTNGVRTATLRIVSNATNAAPIDVQVSGQGTANGPALGFTPASLLFGDQPVGSTSVVQSVTITNGGSAALLLTNVSASTGEFIVTPVGAVLNTLISPSASVTVNVQFTPASTGTRLGTINLFWNNGSSSATPIPVSGTGTAPALTVNPSSLNFGTQQVGVDSAAQTVVLANTGDGPLHLSSVIVIGTNAADFTVVNSCVGGAIQPGNSCSVRVQFRPGTLGARTAQLQISGDATNAPQFVALQGVGGTGVPSIGFSPALLPTFDDAVIGTTSAVQSVTVINNGTASLVISSVALAGNDPTQFVVDSTCVGVSVPAQGGCTINVRFAPTSSGNKGANVVVTSNSGGSPNSFPVKGSGIAPVIVTVPPRLDFGTNNVVGQWSAPQWVQVYNTGDGVLTITNVSLISTNAPDFTTLVDNCTQILPGDSCNLGIAFRASATGLVRTATLVIDSTATNGELRVPLQGSGQAVAPALGVSPVSLLFSNSTVGQTSAGQAITVRNDGTAALVITNLSFSGGGTDQFVVLSSTCVGAAILPNNTCTILVGHTPSVTGATNSNLRILSNAGNGTNLVPVIGFGVAPVIAPVPTSVGFGSQPVGIPSAAQLVLIRNTGDAPFTLSSLSITGTNGGDFAAVPAGCTAVPPGGDCLVSVTFTPGSLGARTGTLLLNGNATNAPVQVPLSGTGTTNATSISLAPANLAFGNVSVGTTSVVQSVTVANNGNAALIITNIDLSVSGEFVLATAGCLNTPLAPGATCTLNLTFVPTHSGATNTLIRIWNNSGVNPATVPVSGVGAAPLISPHPAAVAFGNQPLSITSTAQIIQVQNTGLAPLTLSSVVVSGTTDFVASPIGCTAVAPGGNCNVSVVYTPSTLGATNATLWLTGNADNSPVSVPLTGAGVPSAPVLLFNPTLLPTFGNVSIGLTSVVQSVTVTNAGTAALIISNVTLAGNNPGDFILDPPNTCVGVSVLPGGTCTISVKFTPTTSGNRGADVVVTNNAGNPQSFPVKGAGIAPSILVTPTVLDFGTQTVAMATAPQWVVAKNTGDGPLTITSITFISTNAPDFSLVENNCLGSPIQPGDSCLLGISFTPGAALPRTGTLVIESTATNGEQRVHLSGVGTAVTNGPAIDWTPLNLSFGNQGVGTTSVVQSVTVTNHNTAPLIITNVDLSVAGEFLVSPVGCLNLPLVPGAICTLNVTFVPTNSGVHTSFIRIWNNATVGPAQIPIAGVGTAPLISLQPTVLAFGNQPVGVTSTSQTIQVQNTGTATLSISSATVIGVNASDFLASPTGCSAVPPGGSCSVSVVFNAGAIGARTATLVLTGNADNSPVSVPLSGTGVPAVPVLGFNPVLLPTFGDVVVGATSVVQSVTVINSGNAALAISAVVLAGNNPGDFLLDPANTCAGLSVQPGDACTINVKFIPTASGNRGATVVVTDNASGSPHSFPVKGAGIAPVILAVPTDVNFGTQTVNVVTAPQWVQVYNTGNGPLTLTGLTLISTNAPDFTILTNACLGNPIEPGSSCSIGLTFKPGAALPRTGTLVIDNTGINGQQRIHLSGVGTNTAPALGLNPTSLLFGDTTVGTTSVVQSVTVTNGGTAPLVISSLSFTNTMPGTGNTNGFVVLNSTCIGASILPGGICTIQVAFVPTAAGVTNSNLRILSNVGNGTNLVPIIGVGVAPALTVNPGSLVFGNQPVGIPSAAELVFVQNTGNAPLTLSSVSVTGTNSGDFVATTAGCTAVPPAGSCVVSVTFAPGALGTRTGTLVINGNGTNAQVRVPLSGAGVSNAPSIELTPQSIDFNKQPVGSASVGQTVVITNSGTAALLITNIDLSGTGQFTVNSANCLNVPLAPGAGCTLTVTFAPTNSGPKSNLVRVWNNSSVNPGTVRVSGVGTAPVITPVPTVVTFGNQPIGVTSAGQILTIQNTGDAPLSLSSLTFVGGAASNFVAAPLGCAAIPAGGSCNISMAFTPSGLGTVSTLLHVVGNADLPVDVLVTGTGVTAAPSVGFSPALLPTFGDVVVGTTSAVQSVLVTNTGTGPLVVSNVTLAGNNPGEFLLDPVPPCVGIAVLPGGTCAINIRFKPTSSGNKGANVVVTDNAGGSPHAFLVKGAGIAPVILAAPTSIDFGTQTVSVASAPQWVQVYNNGNGPLTITGLTLISTNAPDFTILTNTCLGSPIEPGSSCSIGLTFKPGATLPRTATLVIDTTGTNGQQRISLSGVGANTAPGLELSPLSLNFGETILGGTSGVQSVTVTNSGTAPLLIRSASLVGGNSSEFSLVTNSCLGAGIAPGSSCLIQLVFAPTGMATRIANLQILSNVGNGTNLVPVRGTGTAPVIAPQPAVVAFGNQPVGITTAAQIIQVENAGTAPLTLTGMTIIGANAGDFVLTPSTCVAVPPGGSCNVSVAFNASAIGARTATLVLTGNAVNSPVSIPLSGTGVPSAPSLGFIPAVLPTFGDVVVGTTSSVQSVTVTNSGNAALAIASVVLAGSNPGDFMLDPANTCVGTPLVPGGTCTINVKFTPSVSGNRIATVVVTDNAGGSPHSFAVKGAGIGPVILAVPTDINFGTQTVSVATAPQWIQVYNPGNGPLTITGLTLAGANAPDFTIQPNTCLGNLIQPGSSCSIGLTFKPSAALARTATLVIDNNGTNGQQRINLTGVGASTAPALGIDPTSLTFGDTILGTTSAVQAVTIANGGTAPLVIGSLSFTNLATGLTNEFVILSSTCVGASIAPNASCTILVGFAPTLSGVLTNSNLRILSNAGNGTNLVPLAGTGVVPVMNLSTTHLDFGTNMVGVSSSPQSVIITNAGNGALVVSNVSVSGLNSGDFNIVTDPCLGVSILPGKTCKISLSFTTTTVLPRSAILTIAANTPTPPQTVTLVGVGTPFVCTPISLVPTNLPASQPGLAYAATLTASGGTAPYQFAVTRGALPPGLVLDAVSGAFSGSPILLGTFHFTVTATDANGCTGSCAYTLLSLVNAHTAPTITTASQLPDGIVGTPYNQNLLATGGTPPYGWTAAVNSALPLGLSLNGSSISGTPSGNGQFEFLITCTGSDGLSAQRVFFVTIKPLVATPSITPPGGTFTNSVKVTLGCATAGATIRYTLDGSDPLSSSRAYNKKAGITVTNSVTLKARAFKLNMADSGVAAASVTIISPPAPAVATASLADAIANQQYVATLQVVPATGVPAYKWSWSPSVDSKLPAGLTLNATKGTISGKPTRAGVYTFTVKVTDVRKITGTQTLTLTVN